MVWDQIPEPPCIFVLGTEVCPFANTVTLVPNDTDDLGSEEVLLPKLVKVAIHFVKYLYVCDNNLIFQIFNVLVFAIRGKYNYMM